MTNRETLLALAARCEAAAVEMQAKLIDEAWDACAQHSAAFRAFATAYVSGFDNNAGKFGAAMDAGAYESAALMLVPEECRFNLNRRPYAKGRQDGYHAQVWFSRFYETSEDMPNAWAATPAHAITAAALRARAAGGEPRPPT